MVTNSLLLHLIFIVLTINQKEVVKASTPLPPATSQKASTTITPPKARPSTAVPTTPSTLPTTPYPPEAAHFHPIYRYSCNEDLSVTFKGVNGIVNYFPPPDGNPKSTIPTNCTITRNKHHFGNFEIPMACLSSQKRNGERTVYVSVVDTNEGEKTRATPNPDIVGPQHVFKLVCMPIPSEGVARHAMAETGIRDIETMHEYNKVDDVEMRFKEGESITSPDVSEVYIGDLFYMYLKYMGDKARYIILPQTCTAFRGTYRTTTDPTRSLELWNETSGRDCVTDAAKKYDVMGNFTRQSATVVHAPLHGFRFGTNIDNTDGDITISCEVRICRPNECTDNCGLGGGKQRRKRRQADGQFKVKSVFKSLRIKKHDELNSNGAGKASLFPALVAASIGISIMVHHTMKN